MEDLSAPKPHPDFDKEYLDLTLQQVELIGELANMKPDNLPVISESEIHKAIKSLTTGKSADEMGLTAEHLKYSGIVLFTTIVSVFKEIIRTKTIPDAFTSGTITPVHKKGKGPCKMVITEESLYPPSLKKMFETVILNRLTELNTYSLASQRAFHLPWHP